MKYSLIVGTLNRPFHLKKCLESLLNQKQDDFEIIVVDQSNDNTSKKIVDGFNCEKIKYIFLNTRGLSRARNIALQNIRGDFFCLIDDDAYYHENYLNNLDKLISNYQSKKYIISGQIWDPTQNKHFVDYNHMQNKKELRVNNILRCAPSPALTFPSSVLQDVGFFDEQFGVGSVFGACEETDYIFRCRKKGYKVLFCSDLLVSHPIVLNDNPKPEQFSAQKHYAYSRGKGAFFKKQIVVEKCYYMGFFLFINFTKKLLKVCLRMGDKGVSSAQLRGLISGYKEYKKMENEQYENTDY